MENVLKDEVTQEDLVKRLEPHADGAAVLLEWRYIHDNVAYAALLLGCALSRVTLNQVPLLLCPVELIVFAAPVLFLLLVIFPDHKRRRRDQDDGEYVPAQVRTGVG